MEEEKNEERNSDAIMAALIIGIWGFVGFCSILIAMVILQLITHPGEFIGMLPFMLIMIGFAVLCGPAALGLVEAMVLGSIGYLIFRFYFSPHITKDQFKARLIVASIIAAAIGLLSFSPADRIVRETQSGKEHIGGVDTTGDGKADKWIHNNIYGKTTQIDYDSNFDGKPDIWEYLREKKFNKKNPDDSLYPEIYRKETDTDFDGKPDKTENL